MHVLSSNKRSASQKLRWFIHYLLPIHPLAIRVHPTYSVKMDVALPKDFANEEVSDIDEADSEEREQFLAAAQRVCSIPSPSVNQSNSILEEPKKKKVDVTVTVVSVAGIHIQDCSKPKLKGFMPKRNTSHNREQSPSKTTSLTTITASFSRREGEMKKNGTLSLASLPVQLGGAFSSPSATTYWPDREGLLSSYHFQQEWPQEEEGGVENVSESVFKPCTVHLAVTNSGQMFNLGRAEILADKVGESSIDTPIIDELPSTDKQTKFIKGNRVKMIKLKEVGLKCGLGTNAMLKVKVQVSEPFCDDPETVAIAVPPSRVGSSLRPGRIRKTFSSSTGSYSHNTNMTSKMSTDSSQRSMDWGVEIQYNTVPRSTNHPTVSPQSTKCHTEHIPTEPIPTESVPTDSVPTESIRVAASMSESSMYSYPSAVSDSVSSLGEDQSCIEYDKSFSWHRFLTCSFPVCGELKQECTDIQIMKSDVMDTYDEEDEPSRSSSYEPW